MNIDGGIAAEGPQVRTFESAAPHRPTADPQNLRLSDQNVVRRTLESPGEETVMLAGEAMTRTVVTVTEDATVKQAARTLYAHHITAAPVVGVGGSMVGIVSELDLFRSEFEHDPRAFLGPIATETCPPPRRVSEVMTRKVISVTDNTDVATVAELMAKSGIVSLPVLHGGELVGIVSRRDLLRVLAECDAQVLDDVLAAIEDLFPGTPPPDVQVHEGMVTLGGQANVLTAHIIKTLVHTVPGVTRVTVVDRAH